MRISAACLFASIALPGAAQTPEAGPLPGFDCPHVATLVMADCGMEQIRVCEGVAGLRHHRRFTAEGTVDFDNVYMGGVVYGGGRWPDGGSEIEHDELAGLAGFLSAPEGATLSLSYSDQDLAPGSDVLTGRRVLRMGGTEALEIGGQSFPVRIIFESLSQSDGLTAQWRHSLSDEIGSAIAWSWTEIRPGEDTFTDKDVPKLVLRPGDAGFDAVTLPAGIVCTPD